MSYYQNGQYYRPGSSHQQQPPANSQYQPRRSSFEAGDEAAFVTNGRGDAYSYGQPVDRRGSYAVRHHDELFMQDSSNPPLDMPTTPLASDFGAQYQSVNSPTQPAYDPRQFPAPVQIPNPQAFGGVNRTQFDAAAPHQPYNPAAYSESNIGRSGTTASRGYGYGYDYPSSPQAQVQFPSPSIPHQSQYSPSRAYSQRPSVQSPTYSNSSGSAPLPPRPLAYSPAHAPPPLPVPPHTSGSPPADWQEQMARRPSMASVYSDSRYNNPLPSPPANQDEHRSSPLSLYHSNPLPPLPQVSPQRTNTSGRHPQSRPLPGPPQDEGDYGRSNSNGSPYGGQLTSDDLYDEVENAVMNAGNSPRIEVDHHGRETSNGQSHPPFYASLAGGGSTATNGHLSPDQGSYAAYSYSDESDAEAAAGLAALQMAEEEERRGSSGATLFSSYSTMRPTSSAAPDPSHESATAEAVYSDDDMAGIDLGAYAGNFEPHFQYGGNPAELASGHVNRSGSQSQTLSSSGSQRKSGETSDADAYDPIHPFPPFSSNARVDTFGTGGFAEPGAHRRRLSYDEGDESSLMLSETSTAAEPPEMFYHPGMSHSRPLPPPPPGELHFSQQQGPYGYQQGRGSYPAGPDQMSTPGGTLVPRSTSLVSHSNTPQTVPPIRSKTDAEERRLRNSGLRTSALYDKDSSGDNLTPPTASTMTLDLPALPAGKRFNPSKLTPKDYAKCTEPWALSSIISWLRKMAEGESDLKEHLITEGLVNLFTYKVPTMNVADAEALSTQVVAEMYRVGTLEHVEEWLKFTSATTSGVLFQLSKAGCYAPSLHEHHSPGRCYSYHCQRTLKKIDLHAQPSVKRSEDWLHYYKLKKEDVEGVNKKEVERQNILHEIVQTEDNFMDSLNVLRHLYRDGLMQMQPPVIPPKKLKSFVRDVFGKVDAVKQANEEHLLPQMKYRQQEQGPWVVGFSDIFREWIRKARGAYIDYAAAFPYATFLVRQEAERNILFRSFLDQARGNKMSQKLAWDNYLKSPITRLQHYGLLLGTVLKRSLLDNEEKKNLQIAIEEIKAVTLECDARVAEMSRKVDLTDLQSKLILRPGMQRVELNLNHLGRELIFKGDLQRMGGTKFTWLETHALLFDHYLVLAKTVHHRDVEGGAKQERYDVSRLPIPMDLLVLESSNDDPVVKSSVKGVATIAPTARPDARLRAGSNASPAPGSISHVNTASSMGSTLTTTSTGKSMMVTTTVLDSPKDERIMYPFRIKHLGKEVYTLFAPSAQNRQDWCDKILEAKTKHAAALFAQNAEPFRLRVMADSAFAYESGTSGSQSVTIKGTPLDRAIDDVEKLFSHTGRPSPICRARVNCATAFMQPYGKPMVAVGTDYGVYISETENPRGWSRSITIPKVTQIAVLEEFSIMLLISDKSLIAYHLDLVCPVGGTPTGGNNSDSSRRAPQKLSGSRDVGFFASGKMKDRTLVFYKKREGLSSTFKVLEPVFQKSTEKKSRFLRTGRTEFFREYDEFYIPTECYGLNLFHSSLAVSTSKGFEVLTLDKKQPWSVPDLKAPHVATIASRLQGLDPLGMFRLSDQEFLLCYEECAVYVNKHGDVSRSVIMEFVGKARAAALYGPYVLLFDPDFVEVRNAQNGRLRQVIPGRDVKCLDDGLGLGGHWLQPGAAAPGGNGFGGAGGANEMFGSGTAQAGVQGRTVKLAMQHPRHEKCQIVVELLLNEGQRD
ncbi:hypothetical protein MPH_07690 [Macrophomina phaseolina MS6]|uniref:Rho1 guanine nucleotide exchange factor 3 n=1 Tax=Macrophomina phaseolina (strain MS6) TaxID=1126212 RepID=K2SE41_MACPH|nr:hypothetical protein MPH_07690 [Macrophomina phaseolina MS6]